jgi:hypothetical protein
LASPFGSGGHTRLLDRGWGSPNSDEELTYISEIFSVPAKGKNKEMMSAVENLRPLLPAILSHLNSFALRFLFLQTLRTSYSYYSSVTANCKEKRKSDRKPYLLSGLRNP